jgi:hypothetical protein
MADAPGLAQLVVTFDPRTRQCNVKGNTLSDRFVTLGMLELAKEALRAKWASQQSEARIVSPDMFFPGVKPG